MKCNVLWVQRSCQWWVQELKWYRGQKHCILLWEDSWIYLCSQQFSLSRTLQRVNITTPKSQANLDTGEELVVYCNFFFFFSEGMKPKYYLIVFHVYSCWCIFYYTLFSLIYLNLFHGLCINICQVEYI